mmetsp:Transcript_18085/g.37693  ORF Transcript_18085/g.37693 Transcript_18085/m.37693 type:complete len:278 (-) Transcript_18085:293-1126(-)
MGVGSNNVGGAGGTTTNVLGDSSVVPVLNIDIVSSVSVRVSKARLERLRVGSDGCGSSANGEVSEVSRLGCRSSSKSHLGLGKLNTGTLGSEVILVLTNYTAVEDRSCQSRGGSKSAAAPVKVGVNLELLQVTRVAVEGDGKQPSKTGSSGDGVGGSGCSSDDNVAYDGVRKTLEGIGDDLSRGGAASEVSAGIGIPRSRDSDGLSDVVLAEVVEELESEGSSEGGGTGDHDTSGSYTSVGVVNVKRVNSNRARPGRAVGSTVSRVTLASHGGILVP